MNISRSLLIALIVGTQFAYAQEKKVYQEFDLELKLDYRYYLNDGLYEGQSQHYPSFAIEPEYYLEWNEGKQNLHFRGFFRWDQQDEQRTHFDVRELYWQWILKDWEVSLGAKKIFWGVTESVHLVDIINQTDVVESFDGEAKLGQPMAHASLSSQLGTFDFFYLPYFRRRQFPGINGRLRTPFLIDKEDIGFENDRDRWSPSFAARWSHSLGPVDLGISQFYGTGREPVFSFTDPSQGVEIAYPQIYQTGLELQAISGPVIWKYEGILRRSDLQDMFAFAAGFEYTFANIANSGLDIGVIGEYLYDDRDKLALSGADNDLFVGSRFAFNDVQSTEILVGGIFDLEKSSKLFSIEASRRLGNAWKVELEARLLSDIDPEDLFFAFLREDSFVQLRLSYFF